MITLTLHLPDLAGLLWVAVAALLARRELGLPAAPP